MRLLQQCETQCERQKSVKNSYKEFSASTTFKGEKVYKQNSELELETISAMLLVCTTTTGG